MKKIYFLFLALALVNNLFSQDPKIKKEKIKQPSGSDSLTINRVSSKVDKNKIAPITDYIITDYKGDISIIDTTLSIQKEYKFNYLRKDNFNLIEFANMGQTYNTLAHDFDEINTVPLFGARARHFNYFEVEDMHYYKVPTPTTELFYRTGMQQGQVLDAFLTLNTTERFNFSIAYKGMRSIGNYQRHLTSTGNFRFTSNYTSKNERYQAKAHIVMQDLLNQESGGLRDQDLENFTVGSEEFLDRGVFTPNLNNAENMLKGKRFYINHSYDIFRAKDSVVNALSLLNTTKLEDKSFRFSQPTATTAFFGDAFSSIINDLVTLEHFSTSFAALYENDLLGKLSFGIQYDNYNYGYDRITFIDNQAIVNRLKGAVVGLLASYTKRFKSFTLSGNGNLNLTGDFQGYNLNSKLHYKLNKDFDVEGYFNLNSALPNFNALLNQSSYVNYNWDNSSNFSNVDKQQIGADINSEKYGAAKVEFGNILNYTYFTDISVGTSEPRNIKPIQANNPINYLKIELSKEIGYRNFGLDNRVLYQKITNGDGVLNVPDFVIRSSLYYSNEFFKKSLFLQTGVTFNYFTAYNMNGYDPLLAEFYVQNETVLGGFPRLDFFINAKVRQTRIYLKAEHFNSSLTGYDYFAAPNYPYRDFIIRFGLVWNFFL